jgi:hypothetical protein
MFKDEKAGNILKELTSKPMEEKAKEPQPDLTDFLDF